MKQLLLTLSFLLLALFSNAQELHIVKDNINCSYGIKDKSGNWVIEPKYILIQQYNSGYFLLKDIEGDGVLNPSGKWIIPCKYDRIETTNGKWGINHYPNSTNVTGINTFFRCCVDTTLNLITTQGVNIATMHAHDEIEFDGEDHLLIHGGYPKTTSYVDTNGNILIVKKPGKILPFKGRDYSLWGDSRSGSDYISGNARLVNRAGEVILEESFVRGEIISQNRIAFEKNGCFGVMTTSGEIIIPPKYRTESNQFYDPSTTVSWPIFDKNNRVGIMRSNGTVMIEPVYDDIKLLYRSRGKSDPLELWKVELNGKLGVIDSSSIMLLPVEYDKIRSANVWMNKNSTYTRNYIVEKSGGFMCLLEQDGFKPTQVYDSLISKGSGGFISKKNGKYGLLNSDGSLRVDCKFTSHFTRKYDSDKEFFSNGKSLTQFIFTRDSIYERKWQPYIVDGTINIVTDSVRHLALQFSTSKNAFVGFDDELSYEMSEDLFMIRPQPQKEYRFYNRKTKQRLPIYNITEIYRLQRNKYRISTRTYKVGVMNSQGKIILNPIYTALEENRNSTHTWAAKPINTHEIKWILMDTNGRQVLPNLFDDHFELNAGDQIARQNKRTGLIDSETLRWKIRPTYSCFFQSIGNYYAILSDQNKKGIIRNDGKFILEPIYDSVVLLTANWQRYGYFNQGETPEIRWWVKRGTTEMLIDQDGKQTTSPKLIRAFFEFLFFEDTLLFAADDQLRVFPKLDYSPSLHFLRGLTPEQIRRKRSALWENPELKRCVFDTIFKLWKTRLSPPQSIYGIYGSTISVEWVGQNSEQERKLMEQERKLKERCNCAQSASYRATTSRTFRLKSIGAQYVSVGDHSPSSISYGVFGYGQESYAPTFLLNVVIRNGKAVEVQLKDIFPSDSVLMEEFIIALKKRDDLQLDCSSLEMMIEMIGGKFSLSESGVRLYLNQQSTNSAGYHSSVELLIPTENLSKHAESKWIAPILWNVDN